MSQPEQPSYILITWCPDTTGIVAGVEAFEAAGGSNVEAWEMTVPNGDPPGCDFHPNLATHRAMADAVIAQLAPAFD